jgi:hypothetical protein
MWTSLLNNEDVTKVIVAAKLLSNHTAVFIEVRCHHIGSYIALLIDTSSYRRKAHPTSMMKPLLKTGARSYDMNDTVGYLVRLVAKMEEKVGTQGLG